MFVYIILRYEKKKKKTEKNFRNPSRYLLGSLDPVYEYKLFKPFPKDHQTLKIFIFYRLSSSSFREIFLVSEVQTVDKGSFKNFTNLVKL